MTAQKRTFPYHVSGIRRIHALLSEGNAADFQEIFLEQVELACKTKIPKNQKRWRTEVRRAARHFAVLDHPKVADLLAKLLHEEKRAKEKRQKKSPPKKDSLAEHGYVTPDFSKPSSSSSTTEGLRPGVTDFEPPRDRELAPGWDPHKT